MRHLITSALPYANGPVHIGHLAGAYLPADIYARFLRLKGEEVLFVSGADEYGTAITETARKQGKTPKEVADENHEIIRNAFSRMGISFDHFSRTTSPWHTATVQEFFATLIGNNTGALLEQETEQLFDTQANCFLADRQVIGNCPFCFAADAKGDQCEKCGKPLDQLQLRNPISALTGTVPEKRMTKHLFWDFAKSQKFLEAFIASHPEWKPSMLGFCNAQLRDGLRERAITRDLQWGVPVPLEGYEGKCFYVWFEAVIGYVSAVKEFFGEPTKFRVDPETLVNGYQPEQWRKWWQDPKCEITHFIGKDNTVFHALLFPAWCHAHGNLNLATNVVVNEFLNLEGQKISTSRNHAIWVHEVVEQFPVDCIRWHLTTILPETSDSDWTHEGFVATVNNDLVATIGNLFSRIVKFVDKSFNGQVSSDKATTDGLSVAVKHLREAERHLKQFNFRGAQNCVRMIATQCNNFLSQTEPWKVIKEDREGAESVVVEALNALHMLAVGLQPFVPDTAKTMLSSLGCEEGWIGADVEFRTEWTVDASHAMLFQRI